MKKIVLNYLLFLCIPFSTHATSFQEKIKSCAACHGSQGIASHAEWPHLAGQSATYLVKQLQNYKDKQGRYSTIMSPISAGLSQTEIQEMAKYYASLPPSKAHVSKKYHQRGENIYRRGDFKKGIIACIICHGPKGTGNAQAGFPSISGQHPAYTIQELQAFKTKRRQNDPNGVMQHISSRMSKKDMIAVAFYLRGLE